jgi:hypothetical protein
MILSVPEYAQHRGVSPQAVRKAIKEGRLRQAVIREGRSAKIDQAAADVEWRRNTSQAQQRTAEQINTGKAAAQGLLETGTDGMPAVNYSKARAYGEGFKAKLLELEYREKAGQLVRVDEVKMGTFKMVRTFRDAVQNIPIRIVNELAAIVGDVDPARRHEMQIVMQREINRCLESLADTDGPR